jgi:hypothetical protein
MGVGGQGHAPTALPPEMTRYPLYRRLGRPKEIHELVQSYGGATSSQISKNVCVSDGYLLENNTQDLCTCSCCALTK